MPRGGKRPGAGRKKGSATKKTREIADKVAAQEMSPLQVMVAAMNELVAAQDLIAAAAIAKDCAPYVHPRLSAVTHKGDKENPVRLVEEIVIVDGDSQTPTADAQGASGIPAK